VLTEDGENHFLDNKASQFCEECNPEAMNSAIADLVNISDLNEMSILHNLRIRFKEDKIYTNISSILISVNPFKLLPLYTPEVLDSYRNGSRGMPPHVFGIAVNAYNNMLSYSENQAVVCSGESGAGKSEATKLILQFLTDVSSKASATTAKENVIEGGTSKSSTLEKQILGANPILEAFGNAKTLRNNNSSRFGKLITINFDRNGSIIGGGIINYLLEKSRIVTQTTGERNYHIFYQLLTASETDPELTAELKLQAPDLFTFTSQSGVTHVDGISDDKDFEEMRNSLSILHFTEEMQHEVFRIVAGVLHFGNVKFRVQKIDNAEDGAAVSNPEVLAHAAGLWGCNAEELEKVLTYKSMGSREVILMAYSQTQAQDARDAMVKQVYSDLFQFLVDKINIELSIGGAQRHSFIGVLDIFGFEHFEVNSFEQLCINYCNEKLQFHFNEHIFRMEQNLYKEEGIIIPGTAFVDNQPTLDLLEIKSTGVFSMIDEEINVPRGSDEGLLQKILTKHAKHPNCVRPKPRECKDALKNFGIAHYAGIVFYNVTNFLEKNKDQLHNDITAVLSKSTMPLVRDFFPQEVDDGANKGGGKKSAKKTLGSQFKSQLNDLVATLNSTFPHFVRCMKSNDNKKGGQFTSSRMQDQLRYAGLVEVCRIRKLGFPVRRPFDEFFKRYRCVNLLSPNLDALLAHLESTGVLIAGEWAKGHSKVFCRTEQSGHLEYARETSLTKVVTIVQKNTRRMIARRKFKTWKKILENVAAAIIQREEEPLAKIIDLAFELPSGGGHLEIIKRAKALLARLREEKRVTQLLEKAIELRNIDSLKSAIAVHAAVNPAFDTPLAGKAKAVLERLEAELAIKAALIAAIAARSKVQLKENIDQCMAMEYECIELKQAQALVARLDEELALIAKLQAACKDENLDVINGILQTCSEQGMETYYASQLSDARKVKQAILDRMAAEEEERKRREEEEERQRAALAAIEAKRLAAVEAARNKLKATFATKDIKAINTVLEELISAGYNFPEVEEARSVLNSLKKQDEVKSQLEASIKTLETQCESGINASDLQPLKAAIATAEKVRLLSPVIFRLLFSSFQLFPRILDGRVVRRLPRAARRRGYAGRVREARHRQGRPGEGLRRPGPRAAARCDGRRTGPRDAAGRAGARPGAHEGDGGHPGQDGRRPRWPFPAERRPALRRCRGGAPDAPGDRQAGPLRCEELSQPAHGRRLRPRCGAEQDEDQGELPVLPADGHPQVHHGPEQGEQQAGSADPQGPAGLHGRQAAALPRDARPGHPAQGLRVQAYPRRDLHADHQAAQ